MNEMEIFVELIDDKEADRILKHFGETPLGTRQNKATFDQKKQHIKKIFKSSTPKMIRKRIKGAADPFYTFIRAYNIPRKQSFSNFLEFLAFINEVRDKVPSYIRFAVLFLEYPEEVKIKLEEIEKNIIAGKDPLQFDKHFESDEALKNYLRKNRSFIGEGAPRDIIETISEFQPNEYNEKLKKCKEHIKSYNLLQYYNSREVFEKEYSLSISNAAYILTHLDEDYDVSMLLAIEAMYQVLKVQDNNIEAIIENKNKVFKETLLSKEREYEKSKNVKEEEISKLKLELSKLRKKMNVIEREKSIIEEQIVGSQTRFHALEKEMQEKFEKHYESSGISIKIAEKEIEILKDKLSLKKIIEEDRINKFKTSSSKSYNWGIVCLTDYELTREIYPEIFVANSNSKDEVRRLVSNNDIDIVYVLMKGLSTRRFNNLKKEIEKNNKIYEVLDFDDYKEFIDWIGYKKTKERNAVRK
ncbi:hypothetical protein H9649_15365 [Sporosarcina sp. Sa2YVA2]|uniref:DUF2326 domain-containing protein n=1 Tax=Sporosarcina quadrami TaxID=2762234 RepID=A0ABR8UDP4_9BACL|nr:hypothetical protein [Sporosarcina quadrami]MBD7985950.1 hypothetical protein [Sporosarcina quadrami]